jgi:hypothetical protein
VPAAGTPRRLRAAWAVIPRRCATSSTPSMHAGWLPWSALRRVRARSTPPSLRRASRGCGRCSTSRRATSAPCHQSLDARSAGRGRVDARPDGLPGHGPDGARHVGASWHSLATRQALDPEPRSPVRPKKWQRDRLMRLAEARPGWALGFLDETWWNPQVGTPDHAPRPACLERDRATVAAG